MAQRFLAVSGVLVNDTFVETVDYLADGSVHVHFASGNNRTFSGDEADGLRRFFDPLSDQLPAVEYPVTYTKTGQDNRVVANADERKQAIVDGFVPAVPETPATQPGPAPVITRR